MWYQQHTWNLSFAESIRNVETILRARHKNSHWLPVRQATVTVRPITRGDAGGRITPYKFFRSPWKNVLDIVWNYWTYFKKIGPFSENLSPPLVSQAGYGPGHSNNNSLCHLALTRKIRLSYLAQWHVGQTVWVPAIWIKRFPSIASTLLRWRWLGFRQGNRSLARLQKHGNRRHSWSVADPGGGSLVNGVPLP